MIETFVARFGWTNRFPSVDTEKHGAKEKQHDDGCHLRGIVRSGREQKARVLSMRKRTHANGRASFDKGVPDIKTTAIYHACAR